jgi:hypothetical protein
VVWHPSIDASQIAVELNEALRRLNWPPSGFTLSAVLQELRKSVEVMTLSRDAESASPLRLRGALQMLINDHWALTDYGLEAVREPLAFAYRAAPSIFGPNFPTMPAWRERGGEILVPILEQPSSLTWDEAVTWMKNREGVTVTPILAPDQPDPRDESGRKRT